MRYILVWNDVVINAVMWDGKSPVDFSIGYDGTVSAYLDVAGEYQIGDAYPKVGG